MDVLAGLVLVLGALASNSALFFFGTIIGAIAGVPPRQGAESEGSGTVPPIVVGKSGSDRQELAADQLGR
jgi:hypothetical protein